MTTVNPFTADAVLKAEKILFKCPTCPNTVSVTLQQIDSIIEVNVVCSDCKNISYVSGRYKAEPKPPGMRIKGSVQVSIARFSDWYYEHPVTSSLIGSDQAAIIIF